MTQKILRVSSLAFLLLPLGEERNMKSLVSMLLSSKSERNSMLSLGGEER